MKKNKWPWEKVLKLSIKDNSYISGRSIATAIANTNHFPGACLTPVPSSLSSTGVTYLCRAISPHSSAPKGTDWPVDKHLPSSCTRPQSVRKWCNSASCSCFCVHSVIISCQIRKWSGQDFKWLIRSMYFLEASCLPKQCSIHNSNRQKQKNQKACTALCSPKYVHTCVGDILDWAFWQDEALELERQQPRETSRESLLEWRTRQKRKMGGKKSVTFQESVFRVRKPVNLCVCVCVCVNAGVWVTVCLLASWQTEHQEYMWIFLTCKQPEVLVLKCLLESMCVCVCGTDECVLCCDCYDKKQVSQVSRHVA